MVRNGGKLSSNSIRPLVSAGNRSQKIQFARSFWRETVLKLNSPHVLAGNHSQIKFARTSWRETSFDMMCVFPSFFSAWTMAFNSSYPILLPLSVLGSRCASTTCAVHSLLREFHSLSRMIIQSMPDMVRLAPFSLRRGENNNGWPIMVMPFSGGRWRLALVHRVGRDGNYATKIKIGMA